MTKPFRPFQKRRGTTTMLAILACLFWSTAFVGVKYGLRFMGPFQFAGIRFMISGLLLLPFCGPLKQISGYVRARWRLIARVCLFQTFILYTCFYLGMDRVDGAVGAIVIGSSPLFSALTAHFFMPDDRMNISRVASIGLGIGGVVIISLSRQPWVAGGWVQFSGVMLLVGGVLSSAMGNIMVAREKTAIPALLLNAVQIFGGGFLLFLVSLPVEGLPDFSHPWLFFADLLWLSVLSSVSVSLWFILLQRPGVKVSELNLWKFIIPVFGALLSWLLLPDEHPELFPVIGMACVAVSIVRYNMSLQTERENRQKALRS